MTISSTYSPIQYTGNGVTTVFAFPYEFYNSTDLIVKSTVIATGVTTTLASPTDYSVSGGSGSTGNVTFVSAPASTVRITIERSIPYTQGQDYQENTAFPASTVETGFDKSVIMAQQTKAISDLALKFPSTDPASSIGEIPNSVSRANSVLSFGASGEPSVVALGSLGADINVSLTGVQNGDALTYNSGVWVNRSILSSLGTNIASAATTSIGGGTSDFVTVTGTTTITSFGSTTTRKHIWVVFSGALTLTHNATSLILPGGANITTAAGDVAECVHISGANWRVVTYQKASGVPVVSPSSGALVYLGTATASASATLDFTSLLNSTNYTAYMFVFNNILPATNGAGMLFRTSTNNGSSWDNSAGNYSYNAGLLSSTYSGTGNNSHTDGQITALVGFNTSVSNNSINGYSMLYVGASKYTYMESYTNYLSTSNSMIPLHVSTCRLTTTEVNAIRFLMESGNITSGTIRLYGVSKS